MRIPNRRLLGIAALAGLLAPVAALAQWTSDATIEQFSWREHTSPIEVHETGPRFAAGLAFTQPGSRGFLFGYRGRVWGGNPSYTGSFQFDATKAAKGASTYLGTTQGAECRYRWGGVADALATVEWDLWTRRLSQSQSEDYRVVSVRAGVERPATATNPISGGLGMRFLLATDEAATITENRVTYDLSLSPGRGSNPYAHAGYRVASHVTLTGYWDGMQLGRSNQIVLLKRGRPQAIVSQPSTDVAVFGAGVSYRW